MEYSFANIMLIYRKYIIPRQKMGQIFSNIIDELLFFTDEIFLDTLLMDDFFCQ